ncbi:MAG: NAD(P)(+) transhydrogenase (Re/Si-specific) subunit beta [Gemmatimonadaceae bacterium]|nr:NAD(P)(+) transhydrogenase (Re/Si-specific) subunit beta [Gemmatimonadaceae bacterium]NUQ93338.1 NAD(P)(+) transhydrogenase (Re/Si-specific) subunit beta [Gemmatimonadaceae bacterium]NUS96595.1 NAD(P)(+) transhydrogenase (Re/Si-specific) subunit beta [Gemmatimonadaceae bacterium]
MSGDLRFTVISLSYVAAALLFIFGLRRLSTPRTARSGNRLAAIGMLVALVATLLDRSIISWWEIAIGTAIGAAIGIYSARRVHMTAMPQMVALFNGMGGATAALVSIAEFIRAANHAVQPGAGAAVSGALGIAIGAISFTGSLVAFGKLQEILPGRPLLFPGRHLVNGLLALAIVALGAWIASGALAASTVWALFGVALLLGVLVVLPIGGGDMPVMISVLNSLTGVAAALTGIVLGNQVLVVAGMLVGASGTLLTLLMSRAMNRPLTNVMFGGFGAQTAAAGKAVARPVRQTSAEDAAVAMAFANRVIVIPGYGLAVAEGQRQVKELSTELEKRGVEVKYAIHPVAGRMPGHMNVLLAEADIPYDQLLDMEQINPEFDHTDVALVVGANDVVNPAARTDRGSPLFGMPILDADHAKNVIVMKRGMSAGFAGVDNELFYAPNTQMLFGDARKSLSALTEALKGV